MSDLIAAGFGRAADASLSRDGGPLRRDGRWVRLLPFAFIAFVATALTLIPTGAPDAENEHPQATITATVLFIVIVALAAFLPWDRLPASAQAVIPFAYMVVVVLVRHAQGSGGVGYTILYILPVVWLALYSPTWQLALALCVVTALIILPPFLDGPVLGEEHYGAEDVPLTIITALIIIFVAACLRFATDAASVDSLTGLPNRRVFMARLRRMSAEARGSGRPFGIAILDLDHFKLYNDAHGHAAGDRLLEATALEWQVATRDKDVLARIGGEEFALLVSDGAAECRTAAERLIAAVPAGQTASAGVAECRPGEDPADAMRRADEALYAAKSAGRARVVEASP